MRALLLGLLVWLAPAVASAQRGIDAQTFAPALDSYGIISVERAQTPHAWDWGFRLYTNYALNPLRLDMQEGQANAIMPWQVGLNLGLHLGLTSWLELLGDIPMSAQAYSAAYGKYGSAAGPDPGDAGAPAVERTGFYAADGKTNIPPPNAAPNDLKLGFKARLLARGRVGLALQAVVTAPFGDEAAFLGDSNFTFRPKIILDFKWRRVSLAFNVGAIVRELTTVYDPAQVGEAAPRVLLSVGHELTYGVGFAYRMHRYVGLAVEVVGLIPLVVAARATPDYTADALAALRIYPGRDITLTVGAGAGIIPGAHRRDDVRAFLGIAWAADEVVRDKGGADSDRDGVPDSVDLCPREKEDRDEWQDDDGCPDPDNDGDGIPDAPDRCPNQGEDKDGFADEDGCPDPDNDGDGIPDVRDRCPNDPEDKDGFQDSDGCPEADNDGDGIPDAQDRCPNEPENLNGIDDADGCPDSGSISPSSFRFDLSPAERVLQFGEAAALTAAHKATLARIAEQLKVRPQVRLHIEGHSDSSGGLKRRRKLATARAEAVRSELVRLGLDEGRMTAVGFGDEKPVDSRRNAEARARNRRVELVVEQP